MHVHDTPGGYVHKAAMHVHDIPGGYVHKAAMHAHDIPDNTWGFTFTRPPCMCMTYLGVYVHKAAMHVHAIPGGLRSQGRHASA
eukprot:9476453-Pyramimonas_sp.AAC.2